MAGTAQRYTAVAIVLHWAIAFAILLNIPLGFWMHLETEHGNTTDSVFRAFQLHKSIGLTVLALSLVRLGWRLANPPPPLPEHMPGWERFVSKATHWAFYALMIGLPLSGWLYVSAGWSHENNAPLAVPTYYFGLFRVPALFGLSQAANDVRASAADAAFIAHYVMAYSAIALAAMHVAAALKHHFFDRDEVLAHMVPGLRAPFETEARPKNGARLAVLGFGLGVTTVAACAAVFAAIGFVTAPRTTAPPPANIEATTPETAPTAPTQEGVAVGEPGAVQSNVWRVDRRSSTIGFAYTYTDDNGDTPCTGRFSTWRADIRFDPNDLEHSSAVVTIQTGSARTGIEAHDNALPAPGWFNAATFPAATFRTTRIRATGDGRYEARGDLTIRGETRHVTMPFTLRIDGDHASMNGTVTIDRKDFDIGDPGGGDDLISREIQINVRVDATRAA